MTWRPDIDSWTSDKEANRLIELANGRRVLEIGTFKGHGAVLMAKGGAKMVHAVDWHRGDPSLGDRDTLCAWWSNIRRNKVEDRVIGHVGRSEEVLPSLRSDWFDMAFIDGYHSYEAVKEDADRAQSLIRDGGIICFHDYIPNTWPGVVKAVKEFRLEMAGWVLNFELVDSLAIMELSDL